MLAPAVVHKEEICRLIAMHVYDSEYQYVNIRSWHTFDPEFYVPVDDWGKLSLVSVDSHGKLGYICASIDRDLDEVDGLTIANYGCDKTEFGKDLILCFKLLQQRFRAIRWTVVIGNPVEPMYDKFCQRMGGRIVGIKMQACRLANGSYADVKQYEWIKNVSCGSP